METFIFDRLKELKNNKKEIEKELNIKISIEGKKVSVDGDPINEYESSLVMNALNFGFSAKKALSLLEPNMQYREINIKKFTKYSRLKDARARLIGTEGKTKRTLENLGNCEIILKGNEVGLICPTDTVDEMTTAISNLIHGSKQSNIYSFLEKMNARKRVYTDDLGLKRDKENKKE